jgi:RHH-type rel operon transcriptional repressor/antitoxin RelB
MLTLELPKDLERRLNLLVARTGQPTSFYAEAAIRDFLDSEEDFLIAADRLANKQPGIILDEVEARLGLES